MKEITISRLNLESKIIKLTAEKEMYKRLSKEYEKEILQLTKEIKALRKGVSKWKKRKY